MMSRRRTGVVGQIQWGDSPVFHTQMIPFTEIRPVLGIRPFVVDGASPPLGLEIKWKYPGLPYSNSTLTIRTDDVWRPNEQRTDTATPPPPLVDAMWHFPRPHHPQTTRDRQNVQIIYYASRDGFDLAVCPVSSSGSSDGSRWVAVKQERESKDTLWLTEAPRKQSATRYKTSLLASCVHLRTLSSKNVNINWATIPWDI